MRQNKFTTCGDRRKRNEAINRVAFFVATLGAGSVTSAAVITQPFVASGTISQIIAERFDPNLGTLDSVEFSFATQLIPLLRVTTLPNPEPYVTILTPMQTVSFGGIGVSSLSPTYIPIAVQAAGVGETRIFPFSFSFGLTFDEISDMPGLVFPSFSGLPVAASPVFGTRADFVSPLPGQTLPLVITHVLRFPFTPSSPGLAAPPLLQGSIAGELIYSFTPVGNAVPEPASAMVMSIGLIAVFARARRSR